MSSEEEPGSGPGELPERDWLLSILVATVNRIPLSFGITLNVPGGLVSGMVVSGNEYFHGVAKEMSDVGLTGEGVAKVMREIAVSAYPMIQPESPGSPADEFEPSLEPGPGYREVRYIHLKDARIYNGNQQIPANRGVWWRGKLRDVAGFCFGTLSAEDG